MKNRDFAALLGASVLSGAGSLPLHLAPLIVPVLVLDARTSVVEAGWVATAVLLGQLATALLLPVLDVRRIGRAQAAVLAAGLLSGLSLSMVGGTATLMLGWFAVGMCCGGFQYLGTITAATHSRPGFAFPIRLGVVLCLAGTVVGILQSATGLHSYWAMMIALVAVFAAVLTVGIVLHQPIAPPSNAQGRDASAGGWRFAALAIVFLLFVGQSGLLAYAVQAATERGIVLRDASWALAGMKIAAGLCLLSLAHKGLHNRQNPRFLELGALLAASNLVIATTTSLAFFFVGLLGLEVAFNILSARLQARISDMAPYFAGQWLVATMLFGAAAGPALHGLAIRGAADAAFMVFAMLSAVAPAVLIIAHRGRAVVAPATPAGRRE